MTYLNEQPLYKQIASKLAALQNCQKSNNTEWELKHSEHLQILLDNLNGAGVSNFILDIDESDPHDKLVFFFCYHHINEYGYGCGYPEFQLTLTPSLLFDFQLGFKSTNNIDIDFEKEEIDEDSLFNYLYDTFAKVFILFSN